MKRLSNLTSHTNGKTRVQTQVSFTAKGALLKFILNCRYRGEEL